MRENDDRQPGRRSGARDLLAQIVRAFEVLAERQYAAPWAAAQRCERPC